MFFAWDAVGLAMRLEECFKILGLSSDASLDEIRQAFKDLVHVWHPDKYASNPRLRSKAETHIKKINMAYAILVQTLSEKEKEKNQSERKMNRNRGSLTVVKTPSSFWWLS